AAAVGRGTGLKASYAERRQPGFCLTGRRGGVLFRDAGRGCLGNRSRPNSPWDPGEADWPGRLITWRCPEAMLNLLVGFPDAGRAVARQSHPRVHASLPAAASLMQVDVITHYRYALDHYLPVPLDAPFLQNSSLGTPYQKWAYFTNEDFGLLSFAVHNLLRYTSRLVHESECIGLSDSGRYAEMKRTSNAYTAPICEIRYRGKAVGVTVHPDHRLSITAVPTEPSTERALCRATARGPPLYFPTVPGPPAPDRD